MSFGMVVNLGPGHIVLDGTQLPHGKGHSSPHFSAHFALALSPVSATAEIVVFSSFRYFFCYGGLRVNFSEYAKYFVFCHIVCFDNTWGLDNTTVDDRCENCELNHDIL